MGVARDYRTAISLLNSLQSNAGQLEERLCHANLNVKHMDSFMRRLCMSKVVGPDLKSRLPMVHIAGTKGKGSTAAFCESILRQNGYKTGLYTSPHLKHVRERIKINGQTIREDLFSMSFFHLWDVLRSSKLDEDAKEVPSYFEYLTLMAFYLFDSLKVDVGIVEAGIGGLHDCTNVIQCPVACIITPIGFDHMDRLGHSIGAIAANKAGIIKPNVPVFFSPRQPESVMGLLKEHAARLGSPYFVAPDIECYGVSRSLPLGIEGRHQYDNAALALAACCHVMDPRHEGQSKVLSEASLLALQSVCWPGRTQKVVLHQRLTVYLDGAHTRDSMETCIEWFSEQIQHVNSDGLKTALIFYHSAGKDYRQLLDVLADYCGRYPFCKVYFTKNAIKSSHRPSRADDSYFKVERRLGDGEGPEAMCLKYWHKKRSTGEDAKIADDLDSIQRELFGCLKTETDASYHVLVTGSLHLVGSYIQMLDLHVP